MANQIVPLINAAASFTCWRQLIRGTECFITTKSASLASVGFWAGKGRTGSKFGNQKEATARGDSDQHSLHHS